MIILFLRETVIVFISNILIFSKYFLTNKMYIFLNKNKENIIKEIKYKNPFPYVFVVQTKKSCNHHMFIRYIIYCFYVKRVYIHTHIKLILSQ